LEHEYFVNAFSVYDTKLLHSALIETKIA